MSRLLLCLAEVVPPFYGHCRKASWDQISPRRNTGRDAVAAGQIGIDSFAPILAQPCRISEE